MKTPILLQSFRQYFYYTGKIFLFQPVLAKEDKKILFQRLEKRHKMAQAPLEAVFITV